MVGREKEIVGLVTGPAYVLVGRPPLGPGVADRPAEPSDVVVTRSVLVVGVHRPRADRAGVEPCPLGGRELEVCGRGAGVDRRRAGDAWDRHHRRPGRHQPRKGHLLSGDGPAELLRLLVGDEGEFGVELGESPGVVLSQW